MSGIDVLKSVVVQRNADGMMSTLAAKFETDWWHSGTARQVYVSHVDRGDDLFPIRTTWASELPTEGWDGRVVESIRAKLATNPILEGPANAAGAVQPGTTRITFSGWNQDAPVMRAYDFDSSDLPEAGLQARNAIADLAARHGGMDHRGMIGSSSQGRGLVEVD